MIHAYNESYLNDAKKTLAAMFDYAVNDCRFNIDKFATFFVKTGYAKQFETGNPGVISGMAGVELANKIIYKVFHEDNSVDSIQPVYKTIEYWAGWVLADYQWYSAYRFKDIFDKIKMSEIVDMYELYHEMDITRFYEKMDSIMNCNAAVTRLKTIREAAGFSQSELAKISGVSKRSIQMYEQRKNDIDKAQGQILYKLAVTLGCSIEDLLEMPMVEK